MPNVLFTPVRIPDGSGGLAHAGEVMVLGNKAPEPAGQGARRLSGI
jgi:hypothetical protein